MKRVVKSFIAITMFLVSSFVSADEFSENKKSEPQLNEQQIMDELLETDSDNEDVEVEHT